MLGLGLGINKYKASGIAPILEEYGIPAAAYSLRYIYPTIYSGDVVLVRRSSDNAEEGFIPEEILDGTLASFCGVGDGFVKTWYDQSGNGRNFTTIGVPQQPLIVSSGSVLLENSKPTTTFNGVSNHMTVSSFDLGADFSIVFLGEANANGHIFSDRKTAVGKQINLRCGNESSLKPGAFVQNNFYAATNNITFNAQYLLSTVISSSTNNIDFYLNGASNGSNPAMVDTPTYDATAPFALAAQLVNGVNLASPYNGNIQELIVFSSDVSSTLDSIEANIADYYGITLP